MKRMMLCIMLMLAGSLSAALTKTQDTLAMTWTKLTDTLDSDGIKSSGDIDVSDCYAATLNIDCCLAETTPHNGCLVTVLGASAADYNDTWTPIAGPFIMANGTAFKSDVMADEAVGQTVISVTNPATGNLDHDGKWVFIYPADDPNIGNCEIAYQIDNSGDAGDTITLLNPIHYAMTTDTDILTLDGAPSASGEYSAVWSRPVSIPITYSRVQVIFNNGIDTSGSNVICRVRVTKVTALN